MTMIRQGAGRKTEEQKMTEPSTKAATANTNKLKANETTSSSSSSADTASHLNKPQQRLPPTPSSSGSKSHNGTSGPTSKDLYSSSSTLKNFQSSPSIYSTMKLPTGCLFEYDGCDEAELLARAKRCQEIMKLSQQAKEAEAARVKAANFKPLSWAKPTFELDSTTAGTTDAAAADKTQIEESQTKKVGKRKGRQEEEDRHLPYHLGGLFCVYPRERPTPEEVQMLLDFTNKWIPSVKRKCSKSSEAEEETEEEKKSLGAP
jgi:hypothetical protein